MEFRKMARRFALVSIAANLRFMLIWEAESYLFRGRFAAATSLGLSPRPTTEAN
jgi:hypothetical protein